MTSADRRNEDPNWGWCPKCPRWVHANSARIKAEGGPPPLVRLYPACDRCGAMLVDACGT